MKKAIVLLALLVALYIIALFPLSALAPRLSVRTPTSTAAPASALLTERFTRLDRLLQEYVDESRISGAVVLVLQDGQTVYERAVGWSDKEAGRRMATNAIFRIASQTKAITSVAALSLVEEGKIRLNDPVSRFMPTFANTTVAVRKNTSMTFVPARRPITIRDLLTHTSGISYGTQSEIGALYRTKGLGPAAGFGWYTADKNEPICETMDRLASLPFIAEPGAAWVYGYSLDILGCVVERASGVPLDEFVRVRITDPLGMKDTHFFLPVEQRERLVAVYSSGNDGRATRGPEGSKGQGAYVDGPRRSFSGGAGLLSTVRDYSRFLEMIRNGGALGPVRILAPRTVKLMTTNQVGSLHSTTGLGFGLGFQTTDRFGANGMDSQGAFGWFGAYGSMYRVDPRTGVVMLLMIQLLPNATDLLTTFPTLVYQALVEPLDKRMEPTRQ